MAPSVELSTAGAAATKDVAAAVAAVLRVGDVVSLTGELGAGKTCFVQGAAGALGVSDRVTSPSFVLRRDYMGRVPVTHIDVYRLDTLQEVLELGYGEPRSVTFVEWGDAMRALLPAEHLEVELLLPDPSDLALQEHSELDGERRWIRLHPHGERWLRRLTALQQQFDSWRWVS